MATRNQDGAAPRGGLSAAADIPPRLQEAWILQLRNFFDCFNYWYLRDTLRPPLFRLGFGRTRFGQWDPQRRTITISAQHILSHPWDRVMETLRHEMAHQYVDEVLAPHGAPSHGEAFAAACRLLRVSSSAASSPEELGSLEESPEQRDRILSRVKLLLALAESPNEHEAASAMRMANKYLLKYNIDLAEAESPQTRRYETRHLGRCSARIQEYEYVLAHILQEHFFTLVIWMLSYDPATNKEGRILQISGTPENLEVAEYVYHYVMHVSEHLWKKHRKSAGYAGGTRLQYLAGLLHGLKGKLDGQKEELKQEHGLVWRGDPSLKEYYRNLHPRISKSSSSGVSRNKRFSDGLRDGRDITIRRGVEGETRRRGRLLPES